MDADDFQDLYKLLRGSRCATVVLDARALFVERKLELSLLKLNEARASFAESRHRVLRQDPEKTVDQKAKDRDRQIKKAKRKQEKAQETLDAFDEVLPVLTKMVKRELDRREREGAQEGVTEQNQEGITEQKTTVDDQPASMRGSAGGTTKAAASERDDAWLDSYSDFDSIGEGPLPKSSNNEVYSAGFNGPQRPACAADFPSRLLKEFAALRGDAKLDLIGGQFSFRPVENELDVVGEGVYLIQTSKRTMLVALPNETCEANELRLFDLVTRKRVKPIPRSAFLDLGMRRKMVLLTCAESGPSLAVERSGVRADGGKASLDTDEVMADQGTAMNDPGTVVDD